MREMITQKDDFGCGAACIAFITGKSYRRIVELLGSEKAKTKGFHLKELENVLSLYGRKYSFTHAKNHPQQLLHEEGTIVFIKRSARYPHGHYLVRHNGMWGDSWINFPYNKNKEYAKSGFRKRLPGKVQWIVKPM